MISFRLAPLLAIVNERPKKKNLKLKMKKNNRTENTLLISNILNQFEKQNPNTFGDVHKSRVLI